MFVVPRHTLNKIYSQAVFLQVSNRDGTGLCKNTKKTTCLGTKLPLVWEQPSRNHTHGLRTVTF